MKTVFFLSSLLFCLPLFAENSEPLAPPSSPPTPLIARMDDQAPAARIKTSKDVMEMGPWLTGPLVSPSAYIVTPGYVNLEPYFMFDNNIGFYNQSWETESFDSMNGSAGILLFFETGILSFMDTSIYSSVFYNFNNGVGAWTYSDLNVWISFQALNGVPGTWIPAIRVAIGETFPTGQYKNLNPAKYGTDAGGKGSFETVFTLIMSQLWHFKGDHYLADRFALQFEVPAPVSVTGFNAYGGDALTDGTVYPGFSQNIFVGLEYTLTKNWALALNLVSEFEAGTTFTGVTGGAPVGIPDYSYVFSLAPAIEYNFSASAGIIGGVWFSVAGRNTANFVNASIAINLMFP